MASFIFCWSNLNITILISNFVVLFYINMHAGTRNIWDVLTVCCVYHHLKVLVNSRPCSPSYMWENMYKYQHEVLEFYFKKPVCNLWWNEIWKFCKKLTAYIYTWVLLNKIRWDSTGTVFFWHDGFCSWDLFKVS